ncbi:hypothetical protein A6P39_013460 [Streptomyces sp. FXJ1.172]|uniref:hypothetical protein n=1 Tax=Streptomyces sp. FXJ1.172 TaxID=710705 RepID=UPI000A793729|nr:hypothetical protein [Streptomyces sp. FXJ1.172]WEO94939.1 hypothetical protein A6P39_013460 [Streptomyces sp. FXJ1.172]
MWITLAVVGVLAMAGGVAWQMWPPKETTVAVPARVCDDALPGTDVKSLLPEKGEPFSQWHTGVFNPEQPYTKKEPGTCKVYGGGKSVTIKHSLYAGSDYTMKNVARDAISTGAIRIVLGEAQGFHKGDTVYLFTACSSKHAETKSLVEVDVTYRKTSDRTVIQKMALLAADTLRLESRNLWTCEGADDLPNSPPRIG